MDKFQIELRDRVKAYLDKNPGKEDKLANAFGVSKPTVIRWKDGMNMPHTTLCKGLIDYLKLQEVEPHLR